MGGFGVGGVGGFERRLRVDGWWGRSKDVVCAGVGRRVGQSSLYTSAPGVGSEDWMEKGAIVVPSRE